MFGPQIQAILLWILGSNLFVFSYGAITLLGSSFQSTLDPQTRSSPSPNPTSHLPCSRGSVCPLPLSVALTNGISIDVFSCGYCDASVFRVPSHKIALASQNRGIPFRNPRFNACMRLPSAYRCLPRPSSVSEPSHPPFSVFVLA